MLRSGWLVLIFVLTTTSAAKSGTNAPRIVSKFVSDSGLPEFHGTIREDETVVQLSEDIKVEDTDEGEAGLVCGYVIHHAKEKRIPFAVDVTNSQTGAATIRVRDGISLDYEHRMTYKFAISAINCGPDAQISDRAMVHIHVEDINEYAPVFAKYSYNLELEEGRLYDNVITLTATDSDRSPEFRSICDYRVTTDNETFAINKHGVLRNKVSLDHLAMANYDVGVIAVDCGQLESEKPAIVHIKVLRKCVRGWTGIPERIEYTPGSGNLKFASNARLDVCDKECKIKRVSVDVTLSTQHIGKGCDRDTYTMHSQRKICGADTKSMELLPSPTAPKSWTHDLVSDHGHDSDLMFSFDGRTDYVEVPRAAFDHRLKTQFTVSTWMRHDGRDRYTVSDEDEDDDEVKVLKKEHIVCMSDSNKMNRHHYSWYLHGNKMVLLLRQEADAPQDKETFRPAEWRWNLDEINDNAWHHYAISVNFPKVELYLDGELTNKDDTELEVVEDWPLHKTTKVKTTKLLVGASWQGGEGKLDMFFKGYLAGLYILNGVIESDQVINCLTNCKENLEFESLRKQHTGMTVSFTRDQTQVSISGENVDEVVEVVRELNYNNARGYPTPGRRNLFFDTSITCADDVGTNKPLPAPVIPRFSTYVLVLQAQTPVITMRGTRNVAYSVADLANGQNVFNTADIEVKLTGQDSETIKNDGTKFLIDKCAIFAEPNMNLKVERLTFPRQHMKLGKGDEIMDAVETNEGVILTGPTSPEQYKRVMRGIVYYNEDAARLSSRQFTVVCSGQNERFVSNQIVFTVSAIHVEPNPEYHAHVQAHPNRVHVASKMNHPVVTAVGSNAPSFGMIAIIVVCVGFLLFVIVLGIFRIRTYQRRTTVVHVDEKQEMEWDDSPLNIIVNPMEQELVECNEETMLKRGEAASESDEEDEDDEDDSSYHEEDEDEAESSEDEVPRKGERELAWDDSTLSF